MMLLLLMLPRCHDDARRDITRGGAMLRRRCCRDVSRWPTTRKPAAQRPTVIAQSARHARAHSSVQRERSVSPRKDIRRKMRACAEQVVLFSAETMR